MGRAGAGHRDAAPGAELTEAALIAHCAREIAAYKKPKRVIFVDAFPALPSGKINKRTLRELYDA